MRLSECYNKKQEYKNRSSLIRNKTKINSNINLRQYKLQGFIIFDPIKEIWDKCFEIRPGKILLEEHQIQNKFF